MKIIQPTFSICLAILCISTAWANPTCVHVGELYPVNSVSSIPPNPVTDFTVSVTTAFNQVPSCDAPGELMIKFPSSPANDKQLEMKFTLSALSLREGRPFQIRDAPTAANSEVFSSSNMVEMQHQSQVLQTFTTPSIPVTVTMIIGSQSTWLKNGLTPQIYYPNFDLVDASGHVFIDLNKPINGAGRGLCNIQINVVDCQ